MKDIQVRVYYEDTDHGGVVYHANYLKFMERGRTEALRELGFEQSRLAVEQDIVFAVSRTDVRYLRPALFDDLLTVSTQLLAAKGARLSFKQQIRRGDELLIEADVLVACISGAGKAKRIPNQILTLINKGNV